MQPTVRFLLVAAALVGLLALSNVCHSDAAVERERAATRRPVVQSAGVPGVRLCPGAQTCDGTNER